MAVGDRRRSGDEQLRVSTWRGDHDVAVLSPRPDRPPPTEEAVRRTVADLAAAGVQRVVTSALGDSERRTFLAAGFVIHERLHLLAHDLVSLPAGAPPIPVRRARTADRTAVLALDQRAFEPFWRLDDRGLQDAIGATPSSRFRVALGPDVAGYAVWGRAGDRGYLQRLATDPLRRRQGVATALVVDGLRWMRRHGVRRTVVNTQEGNEAALAAYLALGFRLEPEGLAVLALDVREHAGVIQGHSRRRAVISLVALAGALLSASPATARSAQQAPTGAPRIELLGQTTWVPADGTFFAGVRITGAPPGADVVVSIHRAVTTRTAFDQSIPDVQRRSRLATFDVIRLDQQPLDGPSSRKVSVLIPISSPDGPRRPGAYRLDKPAVYPLRIVVRGRDGTELSHIVTHLIRLPTASEAVDPSARLRVAPLLTLDAPPTLQPDGQRRAPTAALERIAALVDAVASQPKLALTFDPTPEVMSSLARSGNPRDLALLRRIAVVARADGRQVLSSTYVRLDAAAWLASGLGAQIGRQRVRGTAATTEALGRPDDGTWVSDPDLTPAAITKLRETGVDQLVVPETNLAPIDPAQFPDGVSQPFKVSSDAGVPTPTVQVDARLRAGFSRNDDPHLGAHQLIAELAVVAFAQQGTQGAVVLSPPPGWTPSKPFLTDLFDSLTSDNPLMVTSTLDQVFATVPPAGANGAAALHLTDRGGDLVRSLAPAAAPSLGRFADRLVATQVRLAAYGSMVDSTNNLPAVLADRVDVSGAQALAEGDRVRYLDVVDSELDRRFGAITAPAKEKVTLAARDASFPLSLQSSLPYPVKVLIQLDASDRLTFPSGNQMVVILRGARTRVQLHVRAVSGDTPLRVTVRSADGTTILPAATTRYTVRSTAVSGVGIVLTAGAALFLLLWWGSHWRSSRRPARHAKPRTT